MGGKFDKKEIARLLRLAERTVVIEVGGKAGLGGGGGEPLMPSHDVDRI